MVAWLMMFADARRVVTPRDYFTMRRAMLCAIDARCHIARDVTRDYERILAREKMTLSRASAAAQQLIHAAMRLRRYYDMMRMRGVLLCAYDILRWRAMLPLMRAAQRYVTTPLVRGE